MPHDFRIGELYHVEPSLNSVTGPEGTTRLEPKAMRVLLCLAEHAGEVIPKEQLIRTVWPDTFVTDDVLTRCISELRRALGDDAKAPRVIQTIPRSGYRLIADIAAGGERPRTEARHGPSARRVSTIALVASVVALIATGGWLLFGRRAAGGPSMRTVPITTLPGQETAPAISPDGRQVAFVWDGETGNDDIYVQLIGAGAPLRVTTNPASDRTPAWSPDGRHIAFIRVSAAASSIFLVPALGGPERHIADLNWQNSWELYGGGLTWSPDGKFLVVSDASAPEDAGNLFVLPLVGTGRRQLTSSPRGSVRDVAPAISPDGATVSFVRVTSGGVSDVYLVPFAGGQPRRLTFGQQWLERVAWTRDGRDLVFSSGGALTGGSLWRVPAAGGEPVRLPIGGDNATYPTIASAANRLAYVQRTMDANIWQIDVRKSAQSPAAPRKAIASTRYEAGPQFSRDGRRIVFHSDRSGVTEIWVCDANGTSPLQLTALGTSNTGTPRWSPDGRRIAFDARPADAADIFVIDADGGGQRRVTTEPSDDVVPSWSNDGKRIYFASKRTGQWEVWQVSPEGGPATQVTHHGGFASFESADGLTLYYTKGLNVPGLWKVPVNGGDESPVLDFPKVGYWGYWAVGQDGIYFVNSDARPFTLDFFDFAARRVTHVVALASPPPQWESGLALAPDGESVLYVQQDLINSDIVLADNFH